MLNFEYRIIEELPEKKGKWTVTIIRSVLYKTKEEAEKKLETLSPKENGIMKIEKVLIY